MKLLVLLLALASEAGADQIHPAIELLDANGQPVGDGPVSSMQTCGGCHDTSWIADHSPHAKLGLDEMGAPASGRSFDVGPGALNRFDPLRYDRVEFEGEFTIGIADWLRRFGGEHAGGGFATVDASGRPLTSPSPDRPDAFTHALGPDGEPVAWNWNASGVAELNCFLCHLPAPDDAARREALARGAFGDAVTATLQGAGVVRREGSAWVYTTLPDGTVDLPLRDPAPANCGICHGAVVGDPSEAFFLAPSARRRETLTTGSVFAPGRIARSGMNVAGRDSLARPWDVHAERLLECTDCHSSVNNPAHFAESTETRPAHLRYDARRVDIGEYLLRPSHEFVRGSSAQTPSRRDLDDTMRRCEDCHQASAAHDWLPYRDRHLEGLQCEACHVPQQFGAALASIDWTLLDEEGEPLRHYRGVDGDPDSPQTLLEGYRPVLLPRADADGRARLTPHNLITSWVWTDGENGAPLSRATLERAFLVDGTLHPSVRAALDATGDGEISASEYGLYSPHQVSAIQARLREVGVADPRIRGEVQPFGTHHGVATGAWATRDCGTCHGAGSRATEEFFLADYAPGGVLPVPVADAGVEFAGTIALSECGHVVYQPDARLAGLYLFGASRIDWIERLGQLTVILVLAGIVLHGGLRLVLATGRRRRPERAARRASGALNPAKELS